MIILIKLFLNSKLDLIGTVKFVKQMFRIQIQKGGKVLLWNQIKSRIKACYTELVLHVFCSFILLKTLFDQKPIKRKLDCYQITQNT